MSGPQSQRQEINLYTLEFHRGDQAFSFAFITRCCAIFFVALLLVEAYTGWAMWNEQGRLAQLQQTEQQVGQRLEILKRSQPLSQRPKLEKTLGELQRQVQQRKELQKIMGGQEFGNFEGFSPYLVGLARQANKDMSLTRIHLLEGGNTLQLQGWTRTPEAVPRYLQDLRQEPSLETVRFGVLLIEKDPDHAHKLKFSLGNGGDGSS